MIKAVLDTNVLVSAHLDPQGPPGLVLDLAFAGFFRLFVSESLLQEYSSLLMRPYFGIAPKALAKSIRTIKRFATLVYPRRTLLVTSDPDDNKVVACALEARADFIVTGNVRHFPPKFQDIRVVAPKTFLTILSSEPR